MDIKEVFDRNTQIRAFRLVNSFFYKGALPGKEGEIREFKDGHYKFISGHWKKQDGIEGQKKEGDSEELTKFKSQLIRCEEKLEHYKKKKQEDEAFTTDETKDFAYQKQFKEHLKIAIAKLEKKGIESKEIEKKGEHTYKDYAEYGPVNKYILVELNSGKKIKIEPGKLKGGEKAYQTILKVFEENKIDMINKIIDKMVENLGEPPVKKEKTYAQLVDEAVENGRSTIQYGGQTIVIT